MRYLLASVLAAAFAAASLPQTKQAIPDPYGIEPIFKAHQQINILVGLAPLKLDKNECKKIHDILVAGREKLLKDGKVIQAKEADAVKKLQTKVFEARDKAMKGELPDSKYFDEWDKVMKASVVDRQLLRVGQVQGNADKIKAVLTKDQLKTTVDEAKKAYDKIYPGTVAKLDPKKYGEDTWLQFFVENVLMDDVTIDLLDTMSK